jgi:signal peptidase I
MNLRRAIEADELKQLYLDERLTLEEIAGHFNCSTSTISRRLDELGIPKRPPGPDLHREEFSCEWSADLAYVVGLIATDGNLSPDGRHLTIVSADYDLLETVRGCLKIDNKIGPHNNIFGSYYHLTWGNRLFYDWLLAIGLMPAKSLKLGALDVPDEYFADFFRGCIDGDGSINVYTDDYNAFKNEKYVYTRLDVSLVSASPPFLEWIQQTVERLIGVDGGIFQKKVRLGRAPIYVLKYPKGDAMQLLKWMYYALDVPCLARKRERAEQFLEMD